MRSDPDHVRPNSNPNCWECGYAPARVRMGHRNICGVCWNKIAWLRWAHRVMEEERHGLSRGDGEDGQAGHR